MEKDKRYDIVRKLIISGHIVTIQDIIDVLPKTILTKDLGMHHITFEKYLKEPHRFTYGDTKKIAQLIEVEIEQIFTIILNECRVKEGIAKKNKKAKPKSK